MIPKRRSASWAEMETGAFAAVADMFIDIMLAPDRHRVRRKAGLKGEGRAAAFLAIIAMTDRDADRLAGASGGELAAAAGGGADISHRLQITPSRLKIFAAASVSLMASPTFSGKCRLTCADTERYSRSDVPGCAATKTAEFIISRLTA